MSKKILKRSLALGALMAFVITGSAWAAGADESKITDSVSNRIVDGIGVFSNIKYTGITTEDYQGGVFKANGVATFDNCIFTNNKLISTSTAQGGVIFVSGESDVTINNSTFKNNYAEGVGRAYGAAIANSGAKVTIENSIFDTNFAKSPNDKKPYGVVINCNGASSVTNISNTEFKNSWYFKDNTGKFYTTNGKDVIYMNGGTLNLENVTFSGSGISNFINGQANNGDDKNEINISGTNNTFGSAMGRAIWNRGILTFEKDSITTFSGGIEIENASDYGAIVNFEKNSVVNMRNGIVGTGAVNFNGGTLNGKMSGSNTVSFNGGTWNMTGDSVVKGIVVNGDATINGAKEDGGKSSLTLDRKLTNIEERAINHTSGDLTIQNVVLENINKDNDDSTSGSQGSVIYSRGKGTSLTLLNSTVQNNTNDGEQIKRNAVIRVDGDMTVNKVDFLNNKALGKDGDATAMGGAFYISTATGYEKVSVATITNSTFTGNESAEGGAVFVNKAIVNFENSDFNENHARVNGGALNVQYTGAVVSLDGEYDFKGNTAGKNGGAIAVYGNHSEGKYGLLTIDGKANFTGNEATGQGGAIHNEGIMNVNGIATFTDNIANGIANDIYNAGIININQGAKVTLDGGITGSGTTNINDGNLVLKGGVTNIATLGGVGGIIRFESADAKLEVNTSNNETLRFTATSDVNAAVDGDANKLIYNVDWAKDTTMVMEAGDIVGEVIAELGENKDTGKLIVKSKTEAPNPANQSISDAGISLKLHWRTHMNDMNKRMGELRNADGEHGVWTRMVRGESEYENVKAQYNQYQLGYDEKLSVDKRWTVGAAVTFAEGDANYGYGSTDDKSTAFAMYGTKLNDDGTFVDLIARYAHLESDYEDVMSGKGDYSTNGMSVSAEFGKRIQQGNGLWIEPQVELTYGTIDSAEFQLDRKTVYVGDMDSLIGRVGFSLGKDVKQGNVYARASYLYDFDGETVNAFSNGTQSRYFKEDLGGGWWEVGVGANINLSKATYIYADVEKAFGGAVDTNWQWNLGVRYSF